MRAKRSSILDLTFVLVLFAAGCRDKSPESSPSAAASASSRPSSSARPGSSSPYAVLIGDPASQALVWHARIVEQGRVSPAHPDYLEFRRAIAAGAPLWRRREMLAGEVIFGPLKSVNEAGGALGRLDAALVSADGLAKREALETLAAPLRLFVETSKTLTFSPLVLGQTLSAAAYDLGSLAVESTPAVPDGLPAVLADAQGTLDFIDRGADVLAAMAHEKSAEARAAVAADSTVLRKRLDAAVTQRVFSDRAAFVLLTGKLGVSLRRLGKTVGIDVRPPYRARKNTVRDENDEIVSALTVPARNFSSDDPQTRAYVELGRALFFDKRLSQRNVRSCASCHAPDKGLADGTAHPKSLDPTVTLRHTPSLLYGSLQAAYMWDGRVLTAERQALGVIHAKAEMGLSDADIVKALEVAEDLRPLFAALDTPKVTPEVVARALAAFQAHEFVPADSPVDRFARGEEDALSAEFRAGFDVFAGRGRCARCHVPPFFGGSRPRDFSVPVFAVLGVPTTPENTTIDADVGRQNVTHREADAHAFKTPTVRNIVRTSPYFHQGTFRTLEQVIEFYDRGGGQGAGLSVPNQDPDVRKLGLNPAEKTVLLQFLRVALLDRTSPEELVGKRAATK
jgi:cytochrome c peroxidase